MRGFWELRHLGIVAGLLLAGHAPQASATPLHGLGNVFRSQTPEAYRLSVRKVVAAAQLSELRSGSIEDLQQRSKTTRSAPSTNPAPRGKPAAKSGAGGRIVGRNTRRAAGPSLIGRPLGNGATKSLTAGAQDTEARIQARELIEVLAYFNAENVNWDGHMGANCDYAGFLQTARDVLPEFRAVGAEAVVQAIGEELTGVTIPREVTQGAAGYVATFNSVYQGAANNPLTRDRKLVREQGLSNEQIVQRTLLVNPSYHEDLLALLRSFEQQRLLTPEMKKHLKMCAAGQKPAELKELAAGVQAVLGLQALSPDASVLQMLEVLEQSEDRNTVKELQKRLSAASPRYSEVKEDLAQIWKFVASDNPLAVQAATAQMENAFWRAPMSECLAWLGEQDARLKGLIWPIVDQRIQRARNEAPERLPQYGDSALAVLADQEQPSGVHGAALELLVRLKDRQNVAPLVDLLPRLRRELWPAVGKALRDQTGQDFGPRAGDGLVEMKVAQKKWQRWLESQ